MLEIFQIHGFFTEEQQLERPKKDPDIFEINCHNTTEYVIRQVSMMYGS